MLADQQGQILFLVEREKIKSSMNNLLQKIKTTSFFDKVVGAVVKTKWHKSAKIAYSRPLCKYHPGETKHGYCREVSSVVSRNSHRGYFCLTSHQNVNHGSTKLA